MILWLNTCSEIKFTIGTGLYYFWKSREYIETCFISVLQRFISVDSHIPSRLHRNKRKIIHNLPHLITSIAPAPASFSLE